METDILDELPEVPLTEEDKKEIKRKELEVFKQGIKEYKNSSRLKSSFCCIFPWWRGKKRASRGLSK